MRGLSKIIARGGAAFTPGQPAKRRGPFKDINLLGVHQRIALEGENKNPLDLLPRHIRPGIINMATNRHSRQGGGCFSNEVVQAAAFNWLARRDAVNKACEQGGFTLVKQGGLKWSRAGILAFTFSGSLIAASKPGLTGKRLFCYNSMSDSKPETWESRDWWLTTKIEIGKPVTLAKLKTSPVEVFGVNNEAGRDELREVFDGLVAVYKDIRRQTAY